MTQNRMGILYRFYRPTKVWLNYLFDRIVDLCDMFLMDYYRFPWRAVQNAAQCMARYTGDLAWLLRDFPRLSAYKLVGDDWTIIFVGREVGLREMRHLFFREQAKQQELGRTALWELSAKTREWLTEGADLVICELSRIHPNPPKVPLTFLVPTWIQQVLDIPERLDSLISGKKRATERHRLNKAEQSGFNYRFSQSKADFDHFHHQMYLPYVKARHGRVAFLGRYKEQKQRRFLRGGLVLVSQEDKRVAGVLCHIADDTCFDVERGVLEADPQLFKQGIETIITWYAITWARSRGCKVYDMGSTRAWRSNGAFDSKRRWGAHVVRRRMIYGVWTFLAQNLSPSLQEYLNKLGFITEIDGRFYGVLINGDTASVEESNIHNEVLAAQKQGLAGLVVISPNGRKVVYDSAS